MLYSEDKFNLRLELTIIQRSVKEADIYSVIEEFPHVDFSYINQVLERLMTQGYLVLVDKKLSLTSSGEVYVRGLNRQLGNKGIYRYILPCSDTRIDPLGIDRPYLPLKKKK